MRVYHDKLFSKKFKRPKFTIQHKADRKTASNFHSHSGFEIVWLQKGEATYIFEEKVFRLTKGQILFFKSTDFHKVKLHDGVPYERVVTLFSEDFLKFKHPIFEKFKSFLDNLPSPQYVLNVQAWKEEQLQQIVDHLLFEQENEDLWEKEAALELYLLELLLFLCREIQSSFAQNSHLIVKRDSRKVEMLERILKEINEIWNTDWRLDSLAQTLHLNKYYLCHFFKKEFGLTIHDYILQRRIYEAKKLLILTSSPVNQVSEKVGFSSPSSFIRSFKQQVSMTPKQYRTNTHLL
ncbi:helix-turn-helix domain-containing protein [Fredinandcohnia salidurans]|uniref:Helix-turn-helix domain-containing protein n=1 Tax=Fredinandcohnia salidurans TaxID=2595041 RepID=A0ABW4MSS4_9BACI|nr:AraC family transcriptional regulator [Fredinandcohnia onubensis]